MVRDLRDTLFLVPLYRFLYSEEPGQNVLRKVRKMCIPPRVRFFFFRLQFSTLPVKTRLEGRAVFLRGQWTATFVKRQSSLTMYLLNVGIEAAFVQHYDSTFNPIHSSCNPDIMCHMLKLMPILCDTERLLLEAPIDMAQIE